MSKNDRIRAAVWPLRFLKNRCFRHYVWDDGVYVWTHCHPIPHNERRFSGNVKTVRFNTLLTCLLHLVIRQDMSSTRRCYFVNNIFYFFITEFYDVDD